MVSSLDWGSKVLRFLRSGQSEFQWNRGKILSFFVFLTSEIQIVFVKIRDYQGKEAISGLADALDLAHRSAC